MKIILQNSLKQICSGCPSDWDAKTEDNKDVYIRLRHGYFYIKINNKKIASGHPKGYDGIISQSEMIEYVNKTFKKVQIK